MLEFASRLLGVTGDKSGKLGRRGATGFCASCRWGNAALLTADSRYLDIRRGAFQAARGSETIFGLSS